MLIIECENCMEIKKQETKKEIETYVRREKKEH